MNKKLLLMKHFPASILDVTWDEMPLSNAGRFIRTTDLIKEEAQTLFLFRDGGTSIDKLISDGKTITSFRAIDYANYFSSIIEDKVFTVKADILYIYNIGTELSNSTTFSDKVLHKLVQYNKNAGNTTIVTSDYYNGSTFADRYSQTNQLIDTQMQVLK